MSEQILANVNFKNVAIEYKIIDEYFDLLLSLLLTNIQVWWPGLFSFLSGGQYIKNSIVYVMSVFVEYCIHVLGLFH